MVLEGSRRHFDEFVLPLASGLRRMTPNQVTLVGLLCALPAAALLWRSSPDTEADDYALVFAVPFVFFHGLFDLLDGVIARTYYRPTAVGDFLDHVADRVADIFLLTALAFSPWADLRVGIIAIAMTLLVSYLGTQAQAVGAGRIYTGFVARADRIVLLMFAPLWDHMMATGGVTFEWGLPGGQYALGLVLWYIAIGGAITALERFIRIYLFLHRKEAAAEEPPRPPG